MLVLEGDRRKELSTAALSRPWVEDAGADIIIAAVYVRLTDKYGGRGIQYVDMEAGHAAENVSLQASALHLGTVVVGAFYEDEVRKVVGKMTREQPLCIMPVGHPK